MMLVLQARHAHIPLPQHHDSVQGLDTINPRQRKYYRYQLVRMIVVENTAT
jgi:hypothetical protein